MIALLMQLSQDPILDKIWGVLIAALIGQAVVLGLGLIGFVAVVRRFMDREVPAKLASLDSTIKDMDGHLETIGKELIQMRRDLDRHGYQIDRLEEWRKEQLDETRGGAPRPGSGQRKR